MAEQYDGVRPGPRLLEAAKLDNLDLLVEVFASLPPKHSEEDPEFTPEAVAIADLINNTISPDGDYALHVAASHGSFEVLDELTAQDLVEADPRARGDGAYPLHRAVQWASSHLKGAKSGDYSVRTATGNGVALIDMLLKAGCDTSLKDLDNKRAIDYVEQNEELRQLLLMAEIVAKPHDTDVVDEDKHSEGGDGPPSDDE